MAEKGRRVYVRELAAYLGHPIRQVYRFIRSNGLLRWASQGAAREKIPWVTEQTALRVIAHCRATQGEVYLQGKDFARIVQSQREQGARKRARRAAQKALGSTPEEREHGE